MSVNYWMYWTFRCFHGKFDDSTSSYITRIWARNPPTAVNASKHTPTCVYADAFELACTMDYGHHYGHTNFSPRSPRFSVDIKSLLFLWTNGPRKSGAKFSNGQIHHQREKTVNILHANSTSLEHPHGCYWHFVGEYLVPSCHNDDQSLGFRKQTLQKRCGRAE